MGFISEFLSNVEETAKEYGLEVSLNKDQKQIELLQSSNERKRLSIIVISVLIFFFALIFLGIVKSLHSSPERRIVAHPAKAYTYSEEKASNGFEMHLLKSDPSNITLEVVNKNVTLSDYYGINGGFFFGDRLLSIAMVNGKPAGGDMGQYGAGHENVKYPRGTLLWDGVTNQLSVQIVSQASELKVTDPAHYWAQGGISMSIGHDDLWESQANIEHAPFADDKRLRSALVYDQAGNIYLIVSSTKGTLSDFRAAILETVGEGQLVDGIFLDGDGSSQLQAKELWLPGDNRPIVEMLRLLR
ncbi:hypothetical protein Back11_19600 [Paenibacillus baekrokdamisoli]|uniref:Uncharacterized protein n=1 Tax=Paenibacillus baekrokdamisoli TaxID=1712516 RepID=A0A3G9IWU0_9BACL|nr:hypothetical protein [Paenibacillus baekrokdamisoli]MBB3070037.1 hypothetical protein [Paenibacillus baekrokdamisoli]BBH20615.1 hypothetical protein Back11_19600 [Paenibacillus baekrokdamisoli]